MTRLFIDDERYPPDDGKHWIIARSLDEVMQWYAFGNKADFISFDHDLGDKTPTGMDIAHWLINQDMDYPGILPHGFTFYVHSQNPVGKANIESLLNAYLNQR